MNYGVRGSDGGMNLQATLSIASSSGVDERVVPHHPITCPGELRFDEDGTFSCRHAATGPDDTRTRHCLDHTVALLLIELSHEL
jgi:hypothetical protein